MRYLFTFLILTTLLACSKKEQKIADVERCKTPGALNLDKLGTCEFEVDKIKGSYSVVVTQYDLQQSMVGEDFILEVRDSYCTGFSNQDTIAEIVTLNSFFSPSYFCVVFDGYKSYFDGYQSFWASAYITGTADFTGGKFTFDGLIHNSDSSYRIKMASTHFHHNED